MSNFVLPALAVTMDEPCYSLRELNEVLPGGQSVRRIRTIKVIRADRVAEFRHDLGRADTFTAGEFVIPGGVADEHTGRIEILHTVGELVDIADYLRLGAYEAPPTPQPSDLIGAYREQPERRRRQRKRASQFGPAATIQRA